ncbi:NUDIX domain-containing protein [Candidatus Daviesbacteria bacterium]|nr:NUDIX domain-containing protein [Candidatus Daviesbacteria bacterium]
MQTSSFYASGFLYSLKTHQILLLKPQQTDSADSLWSTLGGESGEGEEAEVTFQRIVSELLDVNLKTKDIYPVYDYFHDTKDKINFVFYAEVKNSKVFNNHNDDTFSWVAFHEVSKLPFTTHSKQDVIVGERVINAKWRDDEARKLESFPETTL